MFSGCGDRNDSKESGSANGKVSVRGMNAALAGEIGENNAYENFVENDEEGQQAYSASEIYEKTDFNLSKIYEDASYGCSAPCVQKIQDQYWCLAPMVYLNDNDLQKIILLKFDQNDPEPECVEIQFDHLAKVFIHDMKEATGGDNNRGNDYIIDRIHQEGQMKVDYYITATLGLDGNIYAIKSVTEYVETGEGNELDILKSDVLCAWNGNGELIKEVKLQTGDATDEERDYYYFIWPTASGLYLAGYHNHEQVCAKMSEDGSFSFMCEMSSNGSGITDYYGNPGFVDKISVTIDDPDNMYGKDYFYDENGEIQSRDMTVPLYRVSILDENMNEVRAETLPKTRLYWSMDSLPVFYSEDSIVYSADGNILSYHLGDVDEKLLVNMNELPLSGQYMRKIFWEGNGDFYALYVDPDSSECKFAVFMRSENN